MKIISGTREMRLELSGGFLTEGKRKLSFEHLVVKDGVFQVLMDGKSYSVELLRHEPAEKSFVLRINGNKYTLQLKDKYDELLHSLGMDAGAGGGIKELKAPMPGLVLDIRVSEGQVITKGDGVVVLEAMKMENILKAAGEAKVKKVHIKKGMTVEKNQVLVSFE
ncbi:MAG: acetyl-CoA carboxylase biotin carboxyl carrier protein subunit [Bacteroidia bacterium]|nr:acetyl-CoA carboxylase biotin carboxyl carrier protein subunit [Bacteroidia bacterium]